MNLSSPANLLIAAIYYILTAFLSLFSVFAVYIFIRYGKSSLLTLIVSLLYAFFFIKILAGSYLTLNSLA